ncbi:hypothetical protein JZU61_01395 [bacterium]|nr:hypothetical protein [bacterium]
MKQIQYLMKPQDVVILLKIIAVDSDQWQQKSIADELKMSQSEVSQSVARSKFAGLLDGSGKKVMRLALLDFLQYGLSYVFPQKPGSLVRGIPTAYSAPPLNTIIQSNELLVWPSAKGKSRGQSIVPLYPSVVDAVNQDEKLYHLLALADALRVGKAREKDLAISELKQRLLHAE